MDFLEWLLQFLGGLFSPTPSPGLGSTILDPMPPPRPALDPGIPVQPPRDPTILDPTPPQRDLGALFDPLSPQRDLGTILDPIPPLTKLPGALLASTDPDDYVRRLFERGTAAEPELTDEQQKKLFQQFIESETDKVREIGEGLGKSPEEIAASQEDIRALKDYTPFPREPSETWDDWLEHNYLRAFNMQAELGEEAGRILEGEPRYAGEDLHDLPDTEYGRVLDRLVDADKTVADLVEFEGSPDPNPGETPSEYVARLRRIVSPEWLQWAAERREYMNRSWDDPTTFAQDFERAMRGERLSEPPPFERPTTDFTSPSETSAGALPTAWREGMSDAAQERWFEQAWAAQRGLAPNHPDPDSLMEADSLPGETPTAFIQRRLAETGTDVSELSPEELFSRPVENPWVDETLTPWEIEKLSSEPPFPDIEDPQYEGHTAYNDPLNPTKQWFEAMNYVLGKFGEQVGEDTYAELGSPWLERDPEIGETPTEFLRRAIEESGEDVPEFFRRSENE